MPAHPTGVLRRSGVRRQQGPDGLEGDRVPRTEIAQRHHGRHLRHDRVLLRGRLRLVRPDPSPQRVDTARFVEVHPARRAGCRTAPARRVPHPFQLGCPSPPRKGQDVKITEVRAFPVGVALDEPLQWGAMKVEVKGGILVRVSTDEGVEGIGEAGFSAEYFATVGPIINDQLGPMLVGRNPLDIAAIWQDMLNATHMWGRRGIETYAVSGIDIALWDILGKVAEQPVYRLLGAAKSRVKAYYAPSLKPTAEIVDESVAAVSQGFRAMKLRNGPSIAGGVDM
ncbi:MAG: hypothetical protein EON55_23000, partial [Alphaproteobacteria bacterium]